MKKLLQQFLILFSNIYEFASKISPHLLSFSIRKFCLFFLKTFSLNHIADISRRQKLKLCDSILENSRVKIKTKICSSINVKAVENFICA